MPAVVAWLGFGGLVPFFGLAAGAVAGGAFAALCARGLLAYGAVILSFVGAVNWGLAMTLGPLSERRRAQLWIWSVIPALVAWGALFLSPAAAVACLIGCLIAQYWQDRRLANDAALPPWFIPLRLRLTVGACVCLAVGGFAASARALQS